MEFRLRVAQVKLIEFSRWLLADALGFGALCSGLSCKSVRDGRLDLLGHSSWVPLGEDFVALDGFLSLAGAHIVECGLTRETTT